MELNTYITYNSEDINDNDYIITKDNRLVQVSYLMSKDLEDASKVVLTDNQDLIKDGVQAIDDEFLEWFVKNPSCEEIEVEKHHGINTSIAEVSSISGNDDYNWQGRGDLRDYKIIIPKEEPKQETFEEARANSYIDFAKSNEDVSAYSFVAGWDKGAKWQQEPEQFFSDDRVKTLEKSIEYLLKRQERMYSEEEVINFLQEMNDLPTTFEGKIDIREWFKKFKKK